MRRFVFCTFMAIALSAGANAAIVTCVSTTTSITAGTNSASFSCNGLTFSNFQLLNLTGATSGRLDINNVTFDTTTGIVNLSENPNLGSAGHENLLFQVTGSISEIDLSMGGTLGTVTERACANPISTTGTLAGLCANAAGTTGAAALAQITLHSGDLPQPAMMPLSSTTSTIFVYKDILTSTGGGLSDMNESFGSVGGVPEPASMALLGSALFCLGLLKRRGVKK